MAIKNFGFGKTKQFVLQHFDELPRGMIRVDHDAKDMAVASVFGPSNHLDGTKSTPDAVIRNFEKMFPGYDSSTLGEKA